MILAGAGKQRESSQARVIADRLAALGHGKNYVAPDAIAELISRASGSEQRLRAGLAGALFLAATEDSPCVERQHVRRALEDLPPASFRKTLPRTRKPLAWALAGTAACLAGISIVIWNPIRRPQVAAPVVQPPPPAQAMPRPAAQLPERHSATSQPDRSPPRANERSANSPAIVPPVSAPPIPALPDELPASVGIVTGHSGEQALAALRPLTEALRLAGLPSSIVGGARLVPPGPGVVHDSTVVYYYAEDRRLANRVARILDASAYAPERSGSASPRLVRSQSATTPPGTVEIRLP